MNHPLCVALFLTAPRFKEHIQDNLPRDFLTTEQFIQLRRELASVNGHSGEEAQPGADMPTGAEDITDPAKVRRRGCSAAFLRTCWLEDELVCRWFRAALAQVFL